MNADLESICSRYNILLPGTTKALLSTVIYVFSCTKTVICSDSPFDILTILLKVTNHIFCESCIWAEMLNVNSYTICVALTCNFRELVCILCHQFNRKSELNVISKRFTKNYLVAVINYLFGFPSFTKLIYRNMVLSVYSLTSAYYLNNLTIDFVTIATSLGFKT